MKNTASLLGKIVLLPLVALLLVLPGCVQREVFYFSGPVAQSETVSVESTIDSVYTSEEAAAMAVIVWQERYPLEASTATPTPAKFPAGFASSPAVAGRAMESAKMNKLDRRLLALQKRADTAGIQQQPTPSSLPLPFSSKAALVLMVISLVALGMLFISTLSLSTYVLAIMIGFGTFIPAVVTALNGKSKASKNPEMYNERGATTVRNLALVLTALLAGLAIIASVI